MGVTGRVRTAALPFAVAGLIAACTTAEPHPRAGGSPPPAGELESSESPTGIAQRRADLPDPRTEVAGTGWNGQIVAVGGLDAQGRAVTNMDVYHPATDAWSRGPALPVALHHTAVATLDDRLYVIGGYTIDGRAWVPQAAVWSIGPGEDEWQPAPSLGSPRGALAVAATGDRLVAVAGVGPGDQVLTSTEVLQSSAERERASDSEPPGQGWVAGPELSTPREHLAATATGDEVYAITGRSGGLETNYDSVEVLRDGAWQDAPPLTSSRGGIAAATVDGMPCVAGGEEPAGTIGSIECLTDDRWQVVDELDVPRHGLAVTALDGALHVIGGGPEPGLTVSGVHEVIDVTAP
jgi:hypothetical protein